jgi:hypothetical protein
MSDLPKGKGKTIGKSVEPKFSKIQVKGKALNKSVEPSMAKLKK